ncbi:iron-sulfur cluster biosynthesis family protein [Fructilactobacillus sp. Tb1]|uniref:iron-sulfur cluster biosynthesis family protein n=1 Tax=Fructilactobacillus sp. Tb1 TaxID=3422304 RepID=UPI003D2C775A
MDLTITNDALAYIEKRLPDAKYYILTADDGSNQYSRGGGACTVGDTFQVVGVTKLEAPYDQELNTNQDVPFYTSKNDETFFDEGLKLSFVNNWLRLTTNNEILDGQVTTADFTKPVKDEGMGAIKGC